MPAISTSECYANAHNLSDKVILITGASSGFGRALAVEFAKHGAKLVLGDVDERGLQETARQVSEVGAKHGRAEGPTMRDTAERSDTASNKQTVVTRICDVTSWESQLALFSAGIKAFNHIDIVLPNAGVSEIGRFDQRLEDEDLLKVGPTKPNFKTLDIDLIGVLYTTRIALWYFGTDERSEKEKEGRAIAFTGSMSSFYGANYGVMYGVAKAGILGIQKGLIETAKTLSLRLVTICPYFVKTGIIDSSFIHPNPKQGFAQISDVVAAFVGALTDTKEETNFTAWLVPDGKGVYRMETNGYLVGAEGARRPKERKEKVEKGEVGMLKAADKLSKL